jgi:hypothetical protein
VSKVKRIVFITDSNVQEAMHAIITFYKQPVGIVT